MDCTRCGGLLTRCIVIVVVRMSSPSRPYVNVDMVSSMRAQRQDARTYTAINVTPSCQMYGWTRRIIINMETSQTDNLTHCQCGGGAFYIIGDRAYCTICRAEQSFSVVTNGVGSPVSVQVGLRSADLDVGMGRDVDQDSPMDQGIVASY